LSLDERMGMAQGRSLPEKLMAAMGQLDCGQCGYDCRRYAQAIASGAETRLNRCAPGGKPTQRMLAKLMEEQGAAPGNGTGATPPRQAPVADSPPPPSTAVTAVTAVTAPQPAPSPGPQTGGYSRERPANAFLARCQRLCKPGSAKDTRLIMLDLAEPDLTYTAGDSLGIYPENWEGLVDSILDALCYSGEEAVPGANGAPLAVRDALMARDLAHITPALIELIGRQADSPAARRALERAVQREEHADDGAGPDVLDVLREFPGLRLPAAAFAQALDPLQPRLYSISSSPRAFPRQVHLTVDAVRFSRDGRLRKGVASTYLCERLQAGRALPVYVQAGHGFRLPQDPHTPIVMIGPGTGIAPFRAFLQERQAGGQAGKSWLFFGNPHRQTDFLYEEELAGFLRAGVLTRLDAAFSRDQPQKVYVQHLMAAHGRDLWAWLAEGAHVYVCGDAKRMARDVHRCLRQIAADHGGLSGERADDHLAAMARAGRYLRDVY
jgi:sulfite reductase (NADPH) flavoprotein alpha-component